MKFVLATGNMNKLVEMQSILSELSIEVVSKYDVGVDIEVDETGADFRENALLKANSVCNLSGIPAIADDSGLVVEALDGAPGVHSKRFGGGGLSDSELCDYLLQKMENVEQRAAKFVCSITCVFPNGDTVSAEGECRGEILTVPRGNGGFGYDPVFLVRDTGRSMAELSPDEKNAVSHRGAALRDFSRELYKYLEGKDNLC